MKKKNSTFSGLAIGGPLDGKSISHISDYYRVPEVLAVPKRFTSFEETMTEVTKIDTFDYAFYEIPGGFVWIPMAVKKHERYEHKIWDHPLDYIFSKLVRSYRPDGY